TTKTVDNDEIFNAFDAKTRAQQQQVIAALDSALAGRSGDIQAILPQLSSVIANLAPVARVYEADDPVVDQVFTSLDTVVRTLADEHVQLGRLLDSGSVALGAIASRDTALVTTLREATSVQTQLDAVLSATVTQQQQAINQASPAIGAQHGFVDQLVGP